MDCQEYRILITAYIDGELSEDEMRVLKAHLSTCKACVAYLNRAEAMKTVLKRSHLIQPAPEVPANFAQRVSSAIGTTLQRERPPLAVRIARKYRDFVLGWAEKWRQSLRVRPYAWITSAASLCVVLAGLTFINLFRTVYDQPQITETPHVIARLEQAVTPAETIEPAALKSKAPQPVVFSEARDAASKGEAAEQPPIIMRAAPQTPSAQFDGVTPHVMVSAAREEEVVEFASDQSAELSALIQVSGEPVVQVAHNSAKLMDNYVYSHVLEAVQEQGFDDTVFVGYVQNTIFK